MAGLVSVLRLPDEPRSTEPCALVGYVQPLLFLLDASGRWVRPALPTDGCGFPRPAVLEALTKTPRRTVASWVIARTESAGAARTGCDEQWSDMVHVETVTFTGARTVPLPMDPFARIARLRVCVYAVPRSELGSGKPAGSFTGGALVSGTPRDRLGALLAGSPRAVPCSTEATRFAVVTQMEVGRDPMAYIELDGCRRIMVETSVTSGSTTRQREALSQSSVSLVAFVNGLSTSG